MLSSSSINELVVPWKDEVQLLVDPVVVWSPLRAPKGKQLGDSSKISCFSWLRSCWLFGNVSLGDSTHPLNKRLHCSYHTERGRSVVQSHTNKCKLIYPLLIGPDSTFIEPARTISSWTDHQISFSDLFWLAQQTDFSTPDTSCHSLLHLYCQRLWTRSSVYTKVTPFVPTPSSLDVRGIAWKPYMHAIQV